MLVENTMHSILFDLSIYCSNVNKKVKYFSPLHAYFLTSELYISQVLQQTPSTSNSNSI
jgi:hypothetical protein